MSGTWTALDYVTSTAYADKLALNDGEKLGDVVVSGTGANWRGGQNTDKNAYIKWNHLELGKAAKGCLSFKIEKASKIVVSAASTGGKNTSDIWLGTAADGTTGTVTGSAATVTGSSYTDVTYASVPAGTYYLGAFPGADRGVRIKSITVTANAGDSTPSTPTTGGDGTTTTGSGDTGNSGNTGNTGDTTTTGDGDKGSSVYTLDCSTLTTDTTAATTNTAIDTYFTRGPSTTIDKKNSKVVVRMNGKLQKAKCYIYFTTTSANATVAVTFFNNSSETKDRKVQIAPLTTTTGDESNNTLGTIVDGDADKGKNVSTDYTFTLTTAGTYAIGGSADIMIEKIVVTEN